MAQDTTTNTEEVTNEVTSTDLTTTDTPCFIKKKPKPECFYLQDVPNKLALFERCLKFRSPQFKKFSRTSKTVIVDSMKCGVTNITDIKSSNLC